MLDELAAHSEDGRQAATVQQLSITRSWAALVFHATIVEWDGCRAGGLKRCKKPALIVLFIFRSKSLRLQSLHLKDSSSFFFLQQMSDETLTVIH